MAAAVLVVLGLCLALPQAHAAVMDCPLMQCDPGWKVPGKFVDHDAPWDDATDRASGVLQLYFLDVNDFEDSFPEVASLVGGVYTDANHACNLVCAIRYNGEAKSSGATPAGYWMFEQTCDYAPGGQCMCMSSDVCAPGTKWWSDEATEGFEYGQKFKVAASYTTGKLCESKGSGDPHFTGADGSNFDFSGVPNRTFAIISDSHIQVNAFLGGRYGRWDARLKALTWMRQLSIMWAHHVAVLSARPGPDAEYGSGYLDSIVVDGGPLDISPHGSASGADGEFTVTWSGVNVRSGRERADQLHVSVAGSLSLHLTIRPEVKVLRTKNDAAVHFDLQVDSAQFSSRVHGVLGQTYRPEFAGRLSEQKLVWNSHLGKLVVPGDNAEGFIDGVVEDYLVNALDKTHCRFCLFTRASSVDEETASAISLSTSGQKYAARKLLETSK